MVGSCVMKTMDKISHTKSTAPLVAKHITKLMPHQTELLHFIYSTFLRLPLVQIKSIYNSLLKPSMPSRLTVCPPAKPDKSM